MFNKNKPFIDEAELVDDELNLPKAETLLEPLGRPLLEVPLTTGFVLIEYAFKFTAKNVFAFTIYTIFSYRLTFICIFSYH